MFGIVFVTTAMFNTACKPTCAVKPTANILPNLSGALIAITNPLQTSNTNNNITKVAPINPNSSHTTEKTKSLCGSGKNKNFCLDPPIPSPKKPPDPIAYKDCIV